MATVEQLKADYETYKGKVVAKFADLNAKITDLQTQLANVPNVTQAITDLAAEIESDTSAIDGPVVTP